MRAEGDEPEGGDGVDGVVGCGHFDWKVGVLDVVLCFDGDVWGERLSGVGLLVLDR